MRETWGRMGWVALLSAAGIALGGCAEEKTYGQAAANPYAISPAAPATYNEPYPEDYQYAQATEQPPATQSMQPSTQPSMQPSVPIAQPPSTPSGTAGLGPVVIQGSYLQPGTQLVAQLDAPIGVDVSEQGEQYGAHVVTPVVDPSGKILIPAGAHVIGTVARLQPGRADRPATVALSVDAIEVNGVSQPLDAEIVGTDVAASRRGVQPMPIEGSPAGTGATGEIIGQARGVLLGGAIGPGVGTLVSLGPTGMRQQLPLGTAIAVEIERPVNVAQLGAGTRAF